MSIIEELEKAIGKYPEIASLHDPEEYYRWVVKMCAWYKRAREHETARADRWKEYAKSIHVMMSKEDIDKIDNGDDE